MHFTTEHTVLLIFVMNIWVRIWSVNLRAEYTLKTGVKEKI